MLLGRRGRSRAATVADGAWEDEMRLLARKLSQHRDRPRHRFLGSQGLNYGWSNIFVNLCCSRIGASFDVAVALCQTMLSRLAPKASVFLSVFKGACVNLCCCQPTSSGYVEGACLISAEDSQAWVNEMECVGMAIQQVPMAEAKKMLFTQAPQATLEA